MKRFDPFSTCASPSRRAVVRMAAESDPDPDSVNAYAQSHSPDASRGSQRDFCSSSPASFSPSEPSSWTARIRPLVAQTFETSSIATRQRRVPVPRPPYSSSKNRPNRSFSRKSSTTSHGNSWLSSISAARGAIRSRASCRTRSRISRCSSVSDSYGTLQVYGPSEVILENGVIRTMDPALPVTRALAIAGDRIAGGVGTHETALASAERIDLRGRCVLPGFSDSHVHFPTWSLAQKQVRLENTETLDEALERIAAAARDVQPGRWLRGMGWRTGDWSPPVEPTKEALDRVTGDTPT